MATKPTPDAGTYNLGTGPHGRPFRLEYYTDSQTKRRVYTLVQEAASQRDDRSSCHGLSLDVLRKLAELIPNLEP